MRQLSPVEHYRRASAWTTTQALRAMELGERPDDVELMIEGGPIMFDGEPMYSLAAACRRLERAVDRAREAGLGDAELGVLSDDAAAPIREEWTFGTPTDLLYPGLP